MVNKNDAFRVLSTVVGIMGDMNSKRECCSFGFIGMPSAEENIRNTKRFRVYDKISKKHFSPDRYNHLTNPDTSSYLIIDKTEKRDIISLSAKVIEEEMNNLVASTPTINLGRTTS